MDRAIRDSVGEERGSPLSAALALAGRGLLLAAVGCSLVWLPVAKLGSGNITGSDAVLVALWGVTGLDLLLRGLSDLDVETPSIVVLAILVAVLAAAGAELSRPDAQGSLELMLFMKKFGLAAVIPLAAARFRSPATAPWMRALTAAAMGALVAFTLRPELGELLPRPEDWEADFGERATGPVTNPNDLAYAAIGLAILHGAMLPRRPGIASRALLVGVLAGAAVCVVASGSRSGLLGAAAALLLLLARSGVAPGPKLALSAGAAAVVAVGLAVSPVFEERLDRLLERGAAEQNVESRIDAQWLALRTAVRYPLGVGYRNIAWATQSSRTGRAFRTTDSVYLDTLLGAGLGGLVALALLFGVSWRHVARSAEGPRAGALLRAGILAFLVFGAATVVPVSVFLAPLFFTIVSGGSHAADRGR